MAIVGSAGGISAMERVLAELPSELGAALIIVLHLTPQHRSVLPTILGRKTSLMVKAAASGDILETGMVYVAPPDAHLIVNGDATLQLERSELVCAAPFARKGLSRPLSGRRPVRDGR